MKKITLIIVGILFLSGCNSAKKVQNTISKGNYDRAIEISIKKLQKNKESKKKQKYILLLEEAYDKAVARDLQSLEGFKKETNPAIIKQIYETYIVMNERQESLKPILPLYINKENREAKFDFPNYLDEISNAKATLSDYLYANALKLLKKNTKESARKSFESLEYLNNISPNFRDVSNLIEESRFKGTNFVIVNLKNNTNQVIPIRLEDDLLNFDTYGLDKFWTVFHARKDDKIDYNYQLALLFNRIDVSPERIIEKQLVLEKEIKDGKEYLLNSDGHIVKDSLGNGIKVDKYIKVKADFFEVKQEKACLVRAEVVLLNMNNTVLEKFPLESEFVFLHDFGELDGDKRALDGVQLELLNKKEVPFPTNEQIIFDTGEDLKNKLKDIIDDLEV